VDRTDRLTAALRRHQRIGLDTPIFIYHLEGASRYAPAAALVFDALEGGVFDGVTSALTLMELAVRPLQLGRADIADEYEVLVLSFPHLLVVDLDRGTMRRAAELRATYRLRPADALQVGACLQQGATALVTNDRALRRISELEILLLGDFAGPDRISS
jgi:predicted nucleic acid-binding protein